MMCLRSQDLGGGAVRSNLFKIILKGSYLKVSVGGNDTSASEQVHSHISSLKPPNKRKTLHRNVQVRHIVKLMPRHSCILQVCRLSAHRI